MSADPKPPVPLDEIETVKAEGRRLLAEKAPALTLAIFLELHPDLLAPDLTPEDNAAVEAMLRETYLRLAPPPDRVPEGPRAVEMVEQLRAALGKPGVADPRPPSAVWAEALDIVDDLRRGRCADCDPRLVPVSQDTERVPERHLMRDSWERQHGPPAATTEAPE